MPRYTHDEPDGYEDDDDDGYDADNYDTDNDYDPDDPATYPHGLYDDDGPPLVPCPYCKREIAEDVEQCPHCEHYITTEETPRGSKSTFWVVLMVLALIAAAMWVA